MVAIAIQELHKKYRLGFGKRLHVLKGIDLTVKRGQIFGLLGPNGAGKTTLVRILLSIVRPTSGTATLLEKPCGTVAVKARLGYLAENHKYPLYLTGEQLLQYFGRLSGLSGDRLQRRLDKMLELVGMSKWRHTKVKKYSKGMMQRIGLAQAMINDPELLFLDEPTDGVDPIGRKEIRDVLLGLKKDGKTIFLNSHLLSEVEQVCDQVAILNQGRIVRQGTISELTSEGDRYRLGTVGLTGTAKAELRKVTIELEERHGEITFSIDTPDKLDAVVDLLRSHGVSIRHLIPDRESLEDLFVKVVTSEGEAT